MALHVLADLQGGARGDRRIEQPVQRALAFEQRRRGQVVAVQVHQVEGKEDQRLLCAPRRARPAARRSWRCRVRPAPRSRRRSAPACRAAGGNLDQDAVALGPVQAGARAQPHRAGVDPGDRAIAVELDLVQPLLALGRARRRRSELRPEAAGQGALSAPWSALGRAGLSLRARPAAALPARRDPRPGGRSARSRGVPRQSPHPGAGPGERIALLDQSQLSPRSPSLGLRRTSIQPPPSFSPDRRNLSVPLR